ncbi:hypothetical protein FJT64_012442 [Amphibalanus amphitrite]|uniref:Uncharacterized protein n=1 Tax=Amphibalanus amphitrite TaxID=1232801 RepID=A0A6A4V6C0_AMPAM|nr:hypothetical protein FJT64_012442 [Amphibalanus amphitrite]
MATAAFRGTSMRLRVLLCASSAVPAHVVTQLHDRLQTSLREMRIRGQIVVRVLDEMRQQVTSVEDASDQYLTSRYLRHLSALTDRLPPCVLVHGVSRVTTTAL